MIFVVCDDPPVAPPAELETSGLPVKTLSRTFGLKGFGGTVGVCIFGGISVGLICCPVMDLVQQNIEMAELSLSYEPEKGELGYLDALTQVKELLKEKGAQTSTEITEQNFLERGDCVYTSECVILRPEIYS